MLQWQSGSRKLPAEYTLACCAEELRSGDHLITYQYRIGEPRRFP